MNFQENLNVSLNSTKNINNKSKSESISFLKDKEYKEAFVRMQTTGIKKNILIKEISIIKPKRMNSLSEILYWLDAEDYGPVQPL